MSDHYRISGHTELIGLIATPIRHSLSPAMHNMSFEALGLDYVYLAFEIGLDELEATVKGFRAMKLRGWNVSMPNKNAICALVDELSPAAKLCGAVNTVVNDNGKLTGHLTDGIGYVEALKNEGFDIRGKKMTITGAGGAGTAIQIQCSLDGIGEISIFNRDDAFFKRAEGTVKLIKEKCPAVKINLFPLEDKAALKREIATSHIFCDATPMGMKPLLGQSIISDASVFRPDLFVSDVCYAPKVTKLMEDARAAGVKKVTNGLGMMLGQGAAAFKLWTGKDMPQDLVREKLF